MVEEKARDELPKEVVGNEQISDIVLILDKMKPLIEAVSEIDKDEKAKTVPADDEHQNFFLKFDRHSSMLGNFLKNFWNQFKKEPDPFRTAANFPLYFPVGYQRVLLDIP